TGEAWLRGVRFLCDPRALVPRSLIAEALEESLPAWLADGLPDWLSDDERGPNWPQRVLDLCTGGGSLAILAALRFPNASITASDLSVDALALAADNVSLHGLLERVRLVRGDLFDALPDRRFDLI